MRPQPKGKGGRAEAPAAKKDPVESDYAAKLASIPQLASCGKLFKSSEPQRLTEEETEYM
eukprot:scaffold150898_cov45-Prasinocladus_malaysianus.AAC.1